MFFEIVEEGFFSGQKAHLGGYIAEVPQTVNG
jgi:hypothetical protein